MWITEWNIDLLKPTLSDSKANNVIRKIREKHKGYCFTTHGKGPTCRAHTSDLTRSPGMR